MRSSCQNLDCERLARATAMTAHATAMRRTILAETVLRHAAATKLMTRRHAHATATRRTILAETALRHAAVMKRMTRYKYII